SFGGEVRGVCDFTTTEHFQPPTLTAHGHTPMGEAITHALDMVEQRKASYRVNGVPYFRPWLVLITDGGATEPWRAGAARRVKEGEERRALAFFAVGVEGADFGVLKEVSARPPLRLQGLRFRDLFQWLSNSQRSVSHSTPGDQDKIPFKDPTSPGGWAS